MCMNYLPFPIHQPEQESLVTTIMYFAPVTLDGRFDLDIGDCPGEFALDVCFHIAQ